MKNTKDKIKPFAYVIIFLILSVLVITAGSQFYLTESRLQNILDKTISEKFKDDVKVEIKFNKAQLSFSGSFSPMFAIKFNGLELKHDQCDRSYRLNTPYALIPVSVIRAIKGELNIGYIKTGKVDFFVNAISSICADGKEKSLDIKKKISKIRSEKNYDKLFNHLAGIFKNIKGFRFLEFNFVEDNFKEVKKISSKNIKISFTKKNKSIQIYNEFDFKPQSLDSKNESTLSGVNLKIQTIISKSKGLSILARARHLEGVFEIKSQPQKNLNDFRLDLQISDLPLTFLNQVLGFKILSQINAHKVWHNSNAIVSLKKFFDTTDSQILVKVNNIEIFGPVLKAYASDFEFQTKPYFKILNPISWRLENLDLNGLVPLEILSRAKGVVDQYGVLRGSGTVDENLRLNFEGLISDTIFLFSLNGKKAKQILNQSNIILDFNYPKLNFNLENLALKSGSFDGDMKGEVVFNENVDWNFNVKSDLLSLSKEVQSLFDLDQSPFEKINLSVVGQKRNLLSLSFKSQVESLKTKWGSFSKSFYNLSYQPEFSLYQFDLESEDFDLNTKFLKIDISNQNQKLKKFKTTLKLSDKDKSFSLVSESLIQPKVYLSASGPDFNKDFLAEIKVDRSQFIIEGNINSGFRIKSVQ